MFGDNNNSKKDNPFAMGVKNQSNGMGLFGNIGGDQTPSLFGGLPKANEPGKQEEGEVKMGGLFSTGSGPNFNGKQEGGSFFDKKSLTKKDDSPPVNAVNEGEVKEDNDKKPDPFEGGIFGSNNDKKPNPFQNGLFGQNKEGSSNIFGGGLFGQKKEENGVTQGGLFSNNTPKNEEHNENDSEEEKEVEVVPKKENNPFGNFALQKGGLFGEGHNLNSSPPPKKLSFDINKLPETNKCEEIPHKRFKESPKKEGPNIAKGTPKKALINQIMGEKQQRDSYNIADSNIEESRVLFSVTTESENKKAQKTTPKLSDSNPYLKEFKPSTKPISDTNKPKPKPKELKKEEDIYVDEDSSYDELSDETTQLETISIQEKKQRILEFEEPNTSNNESESEQGTPNPTLGGFNPIDSLTQTILSHILTFLYSQERNLESLNEDLEVQLYSSLKELQDITKDNNPSKEIGSETDSQNQQEQELISEEDILTLVENYFQNEKSIPLEKVYQTIYPIAEPEKEEKEEGEEEEEETDIYCPTKEIEFLLIKISILKFVLQFLEDIKETNLDQKNCFTQLTRSLRKLKEWTESRTQVKTNFQEIANIFEKFLFKKVLGQDNLEDDIDSSSVDSDHFGSDQEFKTDTHIALKGEKIFLLGLEASKIAESHKDTLKGSKSKMFTFSIRYKNRQVDCDAVVSRKNGTLWRLFYDIIEAEEQNIIEKGQVDLRKIRFFKGTFSSTFLELVDPNLPIEQQVGNGDHIQCLIESKHSRCNDMEALVDVKIFVKNSIFHNFVKIPKTGKMIGMLQSTLQEFKFGEDLIEKISSEEEVAF